MSSLEREVLGRRMPPPPGMLRGPEATSSTGLSMPPTGGKKLPRGKDFSPLPWSDFFDEQKTLNIAGDSFHVYTKGSEGPVFYLIHGGGYAGLTWACMTRELCARVKCRVLAPDLRGHGLSEASDQDDLSTETQIRDIAAIYAAIHGDERPPVVVIGHSMGGALAVHAVAADLIPNCVGLAVIDVVEGSAMDALGTMVHFLRSRPAAFRSPTAAIEWCLKSGAARNSTAARVAMPSQLKRQGEWEECTWRIDLERTQRHWVGWFSGLSDKFLSCSPPKVLILAGVDRLDKPLMIGQMQGKFQQLVLPKVGHAVQEDSPDRLADELARFALRYKIAEPVEAAAAAPPVPFA